VIVLSANKMARVLIGIDDSRSSAERLTGTERYSREVVAALIEIAPQHRFRLYRRMTNDERQATDDDHRQLSTESVTIRQKRLWSHIGLLRELQARSPDALFVPAHVLPFGFRSASLRKRVRSVVTIHDLGFKHFPSAHPLRQRLYLDWSARHSATYASVVIADSHATQRDLEHFYDIDPRKIRIAYPALSTLVETSETQTQRALSKFDLKLQNYVLHIGTLQPRKNLTRLLEAWARLYSQKKCDNTKLVLAGGRGWGEDTTQNEVARLGLRDSIVITGYVSDKEKSVLMRNARALVFPSLHEGFGFPVIEAHSVGVPVACSNTSSLPEVAGEGALLFDPFDTDAIAQSLERVMTDESLRASLIRQGAQNVARFSWERCASIILDALTNDES
jgi:glycosyltransferase involved in cell wall biosynthesis